jgi:hypothetical protein
MIKPTANKKMHRTTQTLPTAMMPCRHLPRGWAIVGLALVAWVALLIAGYGLWTLVT